ncbi:MAG TPA: type II toxin-antitoxin system prevent-host-death family antitoxin [Bryobacteraceae bacterium]|jgi:prevent-host-death family protein|nr:type II toxin-antitoxin system prevent-host-death family antitoxin [Bryobacteraceae bacterium]
MNTITAFEAKTHMGKLLDRVANGGEIVITRHDKAVARLVPENSTSDEAMRETVAALRRLRAKIAGRQGSSRLSDREIRSAINEDRR